MKKFNVVWRHTYRTNVRSGAFIAMLLMPLVFMVIGFVVFHFISNTQQEMQTGHIGVVSDDPAVVSQLEQHVPNYTYAALSEEEAIAQLKSDDILGYLAFEDQVVYYTKSTSREIAVEPLQAYLTQSKQLEVGAQHGLSPQAVQEVVQVDIPVVTKVVTIDPETNAVSSEDKMSLETIVRLASAYIVGILMMMLIMNYSSIVALEIASEKGTRIMEVILSSVDARIHFYGKLFGATLVMLTQVAFYLVIGLIAISVPVVQEQLTRLFSVVDVSLVLRELFGLSMVYFVAGTVVYVVLAALFGSLISKSEDANKAMGPLSILAAIGFYIGMFALNAPNNDVVRISSQLPFFSPFVMPFRIAHGAVTSGEILLSIALLVLTAILVLVLSAKLYRSSVLVYSDKGMFGTFKQALRLSRSQK